MKIYKKNYQHGFTLIELLITVAISGVLMAGVYTAFKSQQDSYLAQEQVAEMQQNIRAGLDVMVRDMRMAGYDPFSTGTFNIVTATADEFRFTAADLNDDGDDEDISYRLYASVSGSSLGRQNRRIPPPTPLPGISAIADNIEDLEFLYVLGDGTPVLAPTAAQLEDIRSVQISILARARQPDRNYTHADTYPTASGDVWTPPNDNLRRRFQIMTVQLRNMGL